MPFDYISKTQIAKFWHLCFKNFGVTRSLEILIYLLLFGIFIGITSGMANWPSYLILGFVLGASQIRNQTIALLKQNTLFRLIAIIAVYFTISTLWSGHSIKFFTALMDTMLILAFLSALQHCQRNNAKFLENLKLAIISLLLALAFIALAQYALDRSNDLWPRLSESWIIPNRCQVSMESYACSLRDDYYRLHGWGALSNPNNLAYALGFGILLCFERANKNLRWEHRGVILLTLVTLSYVVFLTGSKSVWIAILGCGMYIWGNRNTVSPATATLCITLAGPIIAWAYIQGLSFSTEILPRGTSYRELIWSISLSDQLNNFWWGNGFHSPSSITLPSTKIVYHPHSLFVSTWFYCGIVGYCLLALLVIKGMYQLRSEKYNAAVLLYSIVIFSIDGNHLFDKAGLIWIILWLPLAFAVSNSSYGASPNSLASNEIARATGNQNIIHTKSNFDTN